MQILLRLIALASALVFLSGCAQSEEDSTLPWSQPSGWEHNKMPGMMPNYGERTY